MLEAINTRTKIESKAGAATINGEDVYPLNSRDILQKLIERIDFEAGLTFAFLSGRLPDALEAAIKAEAHRQTEAGHTGPFSAGEIAIKVLAEGDYSFEI